MTELILVNSANFTLGVAVDVSKKMTYYGCQIIDLASGYNHYLISNNYRSDSIIKIYSSTLTAKFSWELSKVMTGANSQIWNSIINENVDMLADSTTDYCNIQVQRSSASVETPALELSQMPAGLNKISVSSGQTGIYVGYTDADITAINFYARGVTKAVSLDHFTGTLNLLDADLDSWAFQWSSSSGHNVYRQYSFDLTVLNGEITEFVEDANVTLEKGTFKTSWLTNSSGQIDTQTLTYGYYNQANGDTLQDGATPYTLTVTHPDWTTYTSRFYITEKTKMTISLQETQPETTQTPLSQNEEFPLWIIVAGLAGATAVILIFKRRLN